VASNEQRNVLLPESTAQVRALPMRYGDGHRGSHTRYAIDTEANAWARWTLSPATVTPP